MKLTFKGKRISGLLTVVPRHEQSFVEDMKQFNFPEARSRKLMEVMGYDKHRLVADGVCVSDLAVAGLQHLFDKGALGRDDFDALILVTQTPDHPMPPTSNVIQGRLQLKDDLFCLDINQGCAGFVVGLMQAFLLLEQPAIRKVVLVNADVVSRKTSPKDRNSYPLIGDAASITVVERGDSAGAIHANIKMDGTRREALMIPAGGMRLPHSEQTAVLEDVGDNNLRAQDHLRMDGSAVFNFVQVEVPPMVTSLLEQAGIDADAVDWFLFHQPNRFMLQKLADKIGIPHDKVPMNVVEKYGNSSGVTIPMAIVENLKNELVARSFQVCLAGFGVGLTWGSMLMRLGELQFCEMLEY
ncbi:3-oxoacyl-ACP synthase III family protein [Roseateles sp.]|uniref:3-oxoacyl-ACP synthase III family protein n=1 Tax=Roseateles sp. TaxID=1971397 RepID=UPI0039E7F3DC